MTGEDAGRTRREADAVGRTATAAQEARERTRAWRTKVAQQQAEQDQRITTAVERVMSAQGKLALSAQSVAAAQAAHAELAVQAAEIDVAVGALKAEGLSMDEVAGLTGLSVTEVRRAVKTVGTKASPRASSIEPAPAGSA